MDFRLDEEQLELRDTVRRLCANRFGHEDLAHRAGGRVERDAWEMPLHYLLKRAWVLEHTFGAADAHALALGAAIEDSLA